MPIKQYPIVSLADMIAAFDVEQPAPGRETSAFIKRWRDKEIESEHRSSTHLHHAVHKINHVEIESIRRSKKVRDISRRSDNSFIDA